MGLFRPRSSAAGTAAGATALSSGRWSSPPSSACSPSPATPSSARTWACDSPVLTPLTRMSGNSPRGDLNQAAWKPGSLAIALTLTGHVPVQCRKMVLKVGRRIRAAAVVAAERQRARIRRQFITRNRRMAFGLALAVVAVGVGAVRIPGQWLTPGVMILPILAGGMLLWPRALRILFAIVALMLAYDWANDPAGLGIAATIVV